MDPLTHTLSGTCIATAFLKKRSGSETLWIMALASNLPDIDALTEPDHPAALGARATPSGAGLERFFKAPVWTVREREGGAWEARTRDLRFVPLNSGKAFIFDYGFKVGPGGRVEGPFLGP